MAQRTSIGPPPPPQLGGLGWILEPGNPAYGHFFGHDHEVVTKPDPLN